MTAKPNDSIVEFPTKRISEDIKSELSVENPLQRKSLSIELVKIELPSLEFIVFTGGLEETSFPSEFIQVLLHCLVGTGPM